MTLQRICDACGQPIATGDSAISGTFMALNQPGQGQGRQPGPDDVQPMDFHDTANCWQRVFAAIGAAIQAAKA